MPRASARALALGKLRSLAAQTCGFSLEQTDDDALLFKIDGAVRRAGGLERYVEAVLSNAAERQKLIEALCTHETRFFRHDAHFRYLGGEYLPRLAREIARARRPPRVRAWSVACSTGEEPTSLAVTLAEHVPASVERFVLGTDISSAVLQRARAMRWPVEFANHIPSPILARYFLKGVGDEAGYLRPVPEVRHMLRFEQANLMDLHVAGTFEIVFCRNVLIYFAAEGRARVARTLLDALTPDGILITGPSEGITHVVRDAEMVSPHIYRRKAAT